MNARFWLMLLLLAAGPLVAQTFTSTPNVAIPDNDPNGVTNTITVPATSDRIRSLRVGVRITHTYDADLYLFLLPPGVTWTPPYTNINNGPVVEPPAGVITLSTKNGASGDNYGSGSGGGTVYANFRSSRDPVAPATTSVRSGGAPFTSQAQWIPEIEYEFDNLYGTNPTGDWTLIVVDGWAIDTGTLVGWQLAYTPVTVPSLIARVSPDNRPGATAVIGAADQVLGHYEFEAVGTVSMTSVVVRSENGVVLNTSFSRIALHEDLNSNGVLDPGEGPTLTGTLSPGATTITLSFGASTSMPSGVTRRFLLVGDVLGSPAATGVSMQILQAADFVATASRSGLFPVRTGLHRLSGPRTYTYAPIGGRFVRDNQAFGLRSTIEVPATDDRIGGLRVGIRINHTSANHIDCFLLPPGVDWHGPYTTGTPPVGAIAMTTDNGGTGDNYGTGVANGPYVFTYFSSDLDPTWPTVTNVTAGTAPFIAASGYRPQGQPAWNALYGSNPTGSWTLVIADDTNGGGTAGGTLLAWTLEYLARPKAALSGTQDFGNSAIGVPSAVSPRTFTISNSGDYPLQVTAINFSGAAPGDFSLSPAPAFPFNVPAGGSTNFNASFTPTAQGVRSASLNVTCNDGGVAGSVVPIAVWGFGNMPPSITLNAGFANNPGLPFKNDSTNNVAGQYEVAVGSTGGTINTVTFTEAAARVLANNLSALRLMLDADSSGTVSTGDTLLATATLNPGSTVAAFTVNRALPANSFENWILVADVLATPLNNAIAFRVAGASDIAASMGVTAAFPVDTGPHPIDSARVFTSTPTGGIAIPNASTTGITNSIVIPATTETVAALRVGLRIDHPADQDLDIYLIPPGVTWAGPFTGTGPAGVIELSSDNGGTGANYGSGTDDFVYANLTHSADPVFQPGANIAGQGAGAAPFTSQYYYVEDAADFLARYNTSPAGTWTLAIADDAGDAFTTGRLISWQIEYLPPGTPEITGLANWGGSNVGVVSGLSPQQYSITNIGSINMTATSIALTGTHAGDWAFVGATGTPVVLAPGAQHSVNLSFTPGAVGPRNANLVVTYSTGTQTGLTRTFALSGAGITIPGVISVATPVNFGTVNMGSSSAATPITINNTGAGNLTINGINTTFAGHTGDWSFTGLPSFPHIIAPSGSLVINGTFTPTAAGNRSMTLRITSNTGGVGGSTSDVVLNGFATRGLISVATPVNFGSVSQGSSSAAIPIQINNTGDGPLTLSALNLAFAGHTGDWGFSGTPTPPTVIPAGGNISFNATFTPTAPGARSMTIRITSNNAGVPGTTTDVVLNGTGVALPGQISVSTPVNFGGVNLGSSSAATPIQINNLGTGDLTISALNLAFTGHTTDWGFTGAPTPPTVIPAGGNISFNATFTPTIAGARSMTIRVISNDAGVPGTTTDIVLNGTGLQGLISVTTPVNFGSVNLGSSSAATPIQINNVGTGDLTISALNLAFSGHTTDWGFAGAPTPPTVIPAGGNISFNATFTPTAAGARSMTIRITSNDAGVPGTTTDIVLNGNGLQGLISVTTPVNFGSVNLGSSSAATPITINNVGTGDLTLSGLNLAFAGHTSDWGFTGAPTPPTVIPAGGNVSFNATFTPTSAGARSMTIRITSNDAGVPGTTTDIVLNGNGLQGLISVTTPVNFGNVNLGSSSAATAITINNVGTGDLTLSALNLAFAGHTADWGFTGAPTPPTIIPAGGNIQFNATFTPTAPGARSMTIRITSNNAGVPGTTTDIVLNGSALQGLISVTTPVSFGSVNLGSSSAATPIQINNVGTGDLTLSALNLAFTGHTSDWGFTGAPTPPTVIPAGGNISFNATFTPTAAGARSMTIRVTSNDAGVPGTTTDIVLNGNGLQGLISVTTPVNFGSVNLGSSSAATPIQINNVGTGDLTLSALNLAFAGHTGDWGFVGAPTPPTVIPAGGNISFNATFTPTVAGARSMTVRVTSNDAGVPGTTTDIVLNGNGLQGLISVTTPVNFGSVNLGSSSAATPITINNVGTGDLTLSALNLAFAGHTADWGFAGAPTPPTVIPAGGNISFNATFTPTAAGARSMTIRVTSNDAGVPGTTTDIVLNGNGLQGLVSVTTPVNFGSVNLGSSSAATPIQISNVGTGDLTLSALNLAFAGHTTDWGFSGAPTPPTVIPAGGNVSFNATFTPSSAGARSMTIRVTSNDAGVPGTTTDIVLNGNGLQGLISVTTPVNFGNVNLGSSSAANPIQINNTGTGDLTISALNLAFAGHTTDWGITGAPTPPTVIPAGGNIQFNATFTPTAAGARSMTIRVASNDAGVPGTTTDIVLNGNGLQGLISVTTPVNFGNVNLGSSSAATPIQINNVGTGDLTVSALNLAFAGHSTDWGFTGAPTPPTVIPAGGNISFNAIFTPTAAGARSMTIRVTSNDAGVPGTTTDIVLNGSALQGLISVATPVNFGNVNLGSSSAATPIQINNVGTGDLTLSALNLAFAGHTADWGFTGAPTPPTVIPAGGNVQFNATFTPTTAGARSMTIRVTSNDGGVPGTTTDIVLNGTGLQGLISVTTPVNFGSVNLGSSSVATPITINNFGTGDLTISALNLAFAGHIADWGFAGAPTPPTVIPAGGNISFNATFTPTVAGARSMTIRITSNNAGVPGTTTDIVLNGSALQGLISVTTPVNFGNVNLGSSSSATPIQINNVGTGDLTLSALNLAFAGHTTDWGFTGAPTPPTVIPAGGNISFNAIFTPTAAGARSMTIRVTSNDAGVSGTTTDIVLNGNGLQGLISVTTPVNFGNVNLGSSSAATPIQINNTGTGDLTITALNLAFAGHTGDWGFSGAPTPPTVIPAGGNVSFNATFTPTVAGPRSMSLRITSNSGGVPGTTTDITLNGTGTSAVTVTGVTISADTGGPLTVQATVSGTGPVLADIHVNYDRGLGAQAAYILDAPGFVVTGNVIEDVPAGTTLTFRWDAYATERHVTGNYTLTLTPFVGVTPGTSGSALRTLQRQGGWARHSAAVSAPTGVFGHTMVYDSVNDRFVVFAGKRNNIRTNETWVYERNAAYAAGWQRLNIAGTPPSPVQYHNAIYESANERMLVFGGFNDATGYTNELWQLNLTRGSESWQLVGTGSPAFPSARYGSAFIIDEVSERAILFGGIGGTGNMNDAWQLSLAGGGATWAAAAMAPLGTAPTGRWGMAGAFDSVNNRLVLYGGYGPAGQTDEVHELTLGVSPAWSQITPTGTAGARYFASYTHDAAGNTLIVQSGYRSGTILRDVWQLALSGPSAHTWTQLAADDNAGIGRVTGAGAFDTSRDQAAFFGGLGTGGFALTALSLLSTSGAPAWQSGGVATGEYPHGRWGHMLVHDHVGHDRLILWGGKDNSTYFTELWVMDRSLPEPAWVLMSVPGVKPAARVYMAYAYDAAGDRLLVHGGIGASNNTLGDLWELDLSLATPSWTQLASGPAARYLHQVAIDTTLNRMFLFGGWTTTYSSETWSYDLAGNTWTLLAPAGGPPAARQAHGLVYDSSWNRLVAFGGVSAGGRLNDVWALDLTTPGSESWGDISAGGFAMPPTAYFAYAMHPTLTDAYVHGGETSAGASFQMWRLDLSGFNAAWWPVAHGGGIPIERKHHQATFDNLGNLYMGYGYADFQAVADLWVMDSSNTAAGWSDAHNRQAPGGMASAAAAYDPVGNRMIAFGGLTGNAHQGGMFQLDLGSPVAQWTPMDATGTWPSPRRAATMVYDNSSVPPRMILFGGRQGISHTTISNQVWALNLGVTPSWQLLATSANPGPRSNHVAVVAGGFMYVWGGMDQTGAYRNDVRRLNLGTLAWSTVTPSGAVPAARVSPGAVYDAPRDRIVFFGGHTASGTVNQLVELDLGAMAWATLAPGGTVPAARLYHVMVHDAAGQRAVIHGGVLGSAAYADLFTLDLTTDTFTQVAPPVAIPQGRWQHTGVWDEAAGRLAIAGGYVGSGLEALTNGAADTWFWGD